MRAFAILFLAAMSVGLDITTQPGRAGQAPIVAVWYRGTPPGVPKLDDLAALRTAGFAGVRWPADQSSGLAQLVRLAASVDLAVVTIGGLDVAVATDASTPTAVIWRALAHGVRVIAIDPGQKAGTGLTDRRGVRRPWVRPAAATANQVSANQRLLAEMQPGPAVTMASPAPRGLEVLLLDGGRGWVLVATNTSRAEVRAVAQLPPGVPAALWVSLLDGSMMSMLRQSAGARWTFTIGAGEALVYVIDKTTR